jgi:N4-gp56 family major capsid protein
MAGWPTDYNVDITQKSTWGSNTVPEIWSTQVLRRAMGLAMFPQFVTYYEELGGGPGDTLHVPMFTNLAHHRGTAVLVAGTNIYCGTQESSRIDITVAEYGNGVVTEGIYVDLSAASIPGQVEESLARDFVFTMDYLVGSLFNTARHTLSCVDATGSATYEQSLSGTQTLAPTGTLSVDVLGQIYDIFTGGNAEHVVPKIQIPGFGMKYGLIAGPRVTRGLKKDAGWQNLQLYNNEGDGIFNSRVGLIEDFVIFETNMGQTAGTCVAFGEDAFAMAVSKPMELFYYPDYMSDANRAQAWKWLSVFGMAKAYADEGTHAVRVFTAS